MDSRMAPNRHILGNPLASELPSLHRPTKIQTASTRARFRSE